ncbi:MAG: enoyl-CoA hydratase/isomerase family protein [Nocardioidaceae bacterium]
MSDLRVDRPPGTSAVVRARLDAPARRNALTMATVADLRDLLRDDPDSTLLLGSTTPGIFSAGADLDADDATRARISDTLYECYRLMVTRPGIVIAVVDGAAVGGGAQLCAATDLRTISAAARWRWVGPGHGLSVGGWILPDLLGRSRGLDLALTGRWMDADEAVRAGFAARVDDDPWQRASGIADALGRCDADAVAHVKQIATRPALLDALTRERERNAPWTGSAPSAREASRASRE